MTLRTEEALPSPPTNPSPGSRWRHFKGTEYTVLCLARDCNDPGRFLVIYKDAKDNTWSREQDEFLGLHESGVSRFTRLG